MDKLLLAGLVFVAVGAVLVAFSLLASAKEKETRFGGIVLIGPLPIAFGSDKEILFYAIALGLVTLAAIYLLTNWMK